MSWKLDGIAHLLTLAPPPSAGVSVTDPRHRVLGAMDPTVPPLVVRARRVLGAHHRRVVVDEVNAPPTGVSTEESDVAARCDERFDVRPHRFAPVFVVADAQEQTVFSEQTRI